MKKTGSCVCGAVAFTANGPPMEVYTCCCCDCRKNAGHLGQAVGRWLSKDVDMRDPDNKLKTYVITKTESGKPKDKLFCGECGVTIGTRPGNHEPGKQRTHLRVTLFDEFDPVLAPTEVRRKEDQRQYLLGIEPNYFI
ncbi:hypothetical protein DICA3_E22254 [Diutina catenulata]